MQVNLFNQNLPFIYHSANNVCHQSKHCKQCKYIYINIINKKIKKIKSIKNQLKS